eukprot:CFRG1670T1
MKKLIEIRIYEQTPSLRSSNSMGDYNGYGGRDRAYEDFLDPNKVKYAEGGNDFLPITSNVINISQQNAFGSSNESFNTKFLKDKNNYQVQLSVSPWWRTCVTMTTEVLGLAVIAMPEAAAKIGYGALVILILVLGVASTWTGLLLQDLKLRHMDKVHQYSDVAKILLGNTGARVVSLWMCVSVFSEAAAQTLTGGIALVNMTEGKLCLAICIAISGFIGLTLTQLRTFHALTAISIVGLITILVPLITTVIALPLQNQDHAMDQSVVAFKMDASFKDIFNALMTVVFGYGGHVFYFAFMSEMKDPADFKKSLFVSQAMTITIFILSATLIYLYAGSTVEAPAINSLEYFPLRKAMHGFLLCHTVVVCAIAMITLMQSFYPTFYGWVEYTKWTPQTFVKYLSLSMCLFLSAYVVVELIPFLDDFLDVVSALTILPFTFVLPPMFAVLDKRRTIFSQARSPTQRESAYMLLCGFVVVVTVIVAILGAVSAFLDIADKYQHGAYGGPFSCATEAYFPIPFPEEELRDR